MPAFSIMLGLAGVIMLIAALAQSAQNRSYAACSEPVTGTITRKQRRYVKNGTSHELTVAYTVNGIAYEKVVGALRAEYEQISVGDEIELRCQPDNPKKAVRPGQLQPKNVRIILFIGVVLLAAGAALFGIGQL